MKFMFLLMCIVCALLLSAFSYAIATGKIPFVHKESEIVEDKATNTVEKLAGIVGEKEIVDDLINTLRKEKEAYEKKGGELTAREQALSNEQELVSLMKAEMEKTKSVLDARIVETEASERINLKRLAVIYNKMEPESAATLLKDMTPERAAKLLNLIAEKQAAAILNSAISSGEEGAKKAGEWSEGIRRLKQEEKTKKGT